VAVAASVKVGSNQPFAASQHPRLSTEITRHERPFADFGTARSEVPLRAHTYKAIGVRRESALVFSFAKPVIGKRFDNGTGGHISSVTFGDAFQLTLQSPQLRDPSLNI